MNPLNLFWLFAAPTKGWRHLVHSKPSIPQLYLAHVIPFSLLPALMVYLAGSKYSGHLVQILSLSHAKLLILALIMFIIELIVVPVMAVIIRQVGEVAQIHPSYREAFILAAVAPTPLWMAPLFFIVPDVTTNLVTMGVAMMAAVGLIYYGIPIVFHVHERGHTNLMFGAVMTAGIIAWAFLMVTTLVILGAMQSLQIAMPSL